MKKVLVEKKENGAMFAKGVVYVRNGQEHEVKARKEVVLSAGSIGSPQILMLSGIGPEEHLKEQNVNFDKCLFAFIITFDNFARENLKEI